MSSASPCRGCVLLNDLQAVPAQHQLLPGAASLGRCYRSTQNRISTQLPGQLATGGSKRFPDPVPSLDTARSSQACPFFMTSPPPSPKAAACPVSCCRGSPVPACTGICSMPAGFIALRTGSIPFPSIPHHQSTLFPLVCIAATSPCRAVPITPTCPCPRSPELFTQAHGREPAIQAAASPNCKGLCG